MARDHTPEAITALVTALRDESGSVRVRAAEALLDRGWGRPTQPILDETPNPYAGMTASELAAEMHEILADLEKSSAPTRPEPSAASAMPH